ncbi:interferon alpha/beta receptor 2-like [Cololabis saira]|uniref:interferon alpha/beta receptor 2-like n=1 Tax=Cololabis saira TaxID=129043 RepID=UPI002AD474AE|nr:interferon alpha/beta receptor 2-like [Cololabis saira]
MNGAEWLLVLLLLHPPPADCRLSLPQPSNVSITSYNMEHTLSFKPDPRTPPDTHFTVQILSSRRKPWKPVPTCSWLVAGQTCNLNTAFKDPSDHYRARVQAKAVNHTSRWTVSDQFQPLTDTVLGPPNVSVSGCGNCLVLQVRVPTAGTLKHDPHLKDMYWQLILHVHRTRDDARFRLQLPYKEESRITYLQPGVEYCVTVSVTSFFTHKSVSSKPQCAFTSSPAAQSSVCVVLGLLCAFSLLALLLLVVALYGSQLSITLLGRHLPRPKLCKCSS